jgi:lipase maturation factor 1
VSNAVKVAFPPAKPVLLFDGDCNFCRRWIARWRDFTGDAVEYIPYQDASVSERFPELSSERMAEAVHLVTADAAVYSGAEAVFRALAVPKGRHGAVWAYEHIPGFARMAEFLYGLVARHRMFFSRLTRLLWGAHVERPAYYYVRSLFIRGLGFVYLIAFLSLFTQVSGLIGDKGILPAQETMKSLRDAADGQGMGFKRYLVLPTFGWIGASEGSVRLQAGAGIALALLVIIGVAPAPCLAVLWALYLSLSLLSQIFLNYQWDILLLETGFLAIFFAPALWLGAARGPEPSRAMLWLLRWLLFRLMFMSGCVKLLSGDPTWNNFTALQYHYETQPLPTWIAWHAHHLSPAVHKFSTFVMFGIEIGLPFLILFPRRIRFVAAAAFVILQVGIALTGNYTFFNLLTILLCLLLLDDAALSKFLPARWRFSESPRTKAHVPRWLLTARRLAVTVLVTVVLLISGMLLYGSFNRPFTPPRVLYSLYRAVAPFRSINSYGLFAVMTTNRMEIIIEGSNDGQEWRAYEFKYKPGALDRRPRFVAPHQPRVDWQMWFASLGNFRQNPWFMRLCQSLLQGSPPVLELLTNNPFPQAPPRYIRARLYEYHFTTPAERARSGHWWRSQYKGPYCPVLSLKQ